jgi:hypothetical protein
MKCASAKYIRFPQIEPKKTPSVAGSMLKFKACKASKQRRYIEIGDTAHAIEALMAYAKCGIKQINNCMRPS